MKATEIKNNVINDLNLVVNLAIEQAEKGNCLFDTLDEYIEKTGANTPDKKEQATRDFIFYSDASEVLDERFSLKYGQFEMNFDVQLAIYLPRKVKNGFGNGETKQPTKNKASELNHNAKRMQSIIADLRQDYHGVDHLDAEQNESRKKAVILAYKKANENDLIKLCWKWIISPLNIEGVHIPYKEEPKAVFTPYYVKNKEYQLQA